MICYLVTRQHSYTIDRFLDVWATQLRPMIRTVFYEDLIRMRAIPASTVIFSDLERLDPAQMRLARSLEDVLDRSGRATILNRPSRVRLRFDLQEKLRAGGINDFDVHRVTSGIPSTVKFPVFIRRENDHLGGISDLIHDRQALGQAVEKELRDSTPRDQLLVVEFCDTRDAQGLYRKYSYSRAGDKLIPRHLLFGRHWMLKAASVVDHEKGRLELEFLNSDPHREQIRRVFDMANIDYGRIDYAIKGEQVRVWEINTNPNLNILIEKCHIERVANLAWSQEMFRQSIQELDARSPTGQPIRFEIDRELRDELGYTMPYRALDHAARTLRPAWGSKQCRRLRRIVGLLGDLKRIDG